MKLLVMGRAYRQVGHEVAVSVITAATQAKRWDDRITIRSCDIMVAPAQGKPQVLLFDEGEGGRLERVAEAVNVTIVTAPFDGFVSTLRREGIIPEGWPRPLW